MNGLTNTHFVGKVLHRLETVGSTNDFAAQLLASKSKPTDGTAVFSDNQSDGRGQIGSRWVSEPGKNLAISFIFYPNFLEIGQQWLISEAAALATHDFLTVSCGIPAKIKWPNDLYFFDKKMGGILIQNSIGTGRKIESTVIGIGLNINQVSWPPELPNPVSLKTAAGRDFDLSWAVENLCKCLEIRYLQLKTNPKILDLNYLQNLYRVGEMSDFEAADGRIFSGVIIGIRPDGRLVISETDGEMTVWEAKEIKFSGL